MAEEELNRRQARSVYLLTYSKANIERFPTRQSFCNAVLQAFSHTPATPLRWVCSLEKHEDGTPHYHMAIKLDRVQRWIGVKTRLSTTNGIQVHFSNIHHNYYSAWQYTVKEDTTPLESKDHPDLSNDGPQTGQASLARAQSRGKRKRERMSAFELTEIIINKKIKTRLELLALANAQRLEGKTDIAEFICNRGNRAVEEAISIGWELDGAQAKLERSKLARIQLLQQALQADCVQECRGRWLLQAKDILNRNQIPEHIFREAILTLLRDGRGKYRNVFLSGPANCGKSFLLQPLTTIYKAFVNPATTSYAWIGVDDAEIILLNDFRWSPQVISVAEFSTL